MPPHPPADARKEAPEKKPQKRARLIDTSSLCRHLTTHYPTVNNFFGSARNGRSHSPLRSVFIRRLNMIQGLSFALIDGLDGRR
jgi:hypothetical protein